MPGFLDIVWQEHWAVEPMGGCRRTGRDVTEQHTACVCNFCQTDIKDAALRPSPCAVPALPHLPRAASPSLSVSANDLLRLSLPGWLMPTDSPTHAERLHPSSPSYTHTHTSQLYIFTMHMWHTCTRNVNLQEQPGWDRLSHINKLQLFVQSHVNRHVCRHTCRSRWQTHA